MPHLLPSIPSVSDCLQLMEDYRMLPNIKAHSVVVAKIGALIAQALDDAGEAVSVKTVIAGALLHDIGKTSCLNTSKDHALKGKEICLAEHLEVIADIVAEHVILKDYSQQDRLTEKMIVYYADKRVNHDMVVSLDERLAYIIDHYGKNNNRLQEKIRKNFSQCRAIEKRIFALLDFLPSDVAQRISELHLLSHQI